MPSSLRVHLLRALVECIIGLAVVAATGHAAEPFVAFETGQVRPLALSPDGTRLFAINTPDNQLEVFVVGAGTLTHQASVPVGLEPIAVAARTDGEVWVVNHLSDSVSVVDVSTPANPHVVRTLLVGDEPSDIVFGGPGGSRAFVTAAHRGQNTPYHSTIDTLLQTAGVGRADVWVFDATQLGAGLGGTPLNIMTFFGDTPRALAVSADGSTVYAAVFRSGNQTTTLSEGAIPNGGESVGGLPDPNTNFAGTPQPEVGLIVQFDGTAWRDELGRDWSAAVRFTLPDKDVFAIDAVASPPVPVAGPAGEFSGVGTVLFNMITNPVTGRVYVSNLESRNRVRFEGAGTYAAAFKPAGEPPSVRGHLAESRVTVLDGTAVAPRHLNKHIDYSTCCAPLPNAENAASLAFPLGMAISSDGGTLYVAGFGSSGVGVYDTTALENDTFVPSAANRLAVSGGGPTGIVLDEARAQLYVLTRFDDAISILSTATGMETAHVALHNPEPERVVAGRRLLYDASFTSSHGDSACASCHVFADLDGLAWDIGDPDSSATANPGPFVVSFGDTDFAPMKGPMTTQSLRGLANHGSMHWRGDRRAPLAGSQPDDGAFDERAAFGAFNQAFVSLLGRSAPLAATEMDALTDFALEVMYPPNPIRNLDNSLTASQSAGRTFYFGATSDTLTRCSGCHVLDPAGNTGVAKPGFFGTDGEFSFENETQHFKIPHLRNLYQKIGMFGMPPIPLVNPGDNGTTGDQIRGFGFLHDGSFDTVFRFHNSQAFNQSPSNPGGFTLGEVGDTQRRQVASFLHAFDSNLAPIVGQQITRTLASGPDVEARIDLLIARADRGECDLVAKGPIGGVSRGALYRTGTGQFQLDRAKEQRSDAALRATANTLGRELTYTCVPPGSGQRIGIDRDGDGAFDRDEIVDGSDPTDPSSLPTSVCGADPTCLKCRRGVTKAAAKHVQAISKAYVACEVAKLAGKIGAATDCTHAPDVKTQKRLTRAALKLDNAIASACGGADRLCGGDATDEPTPIAIGFPAVCPNFASQAPGACTVVIAHCGDVVTCLACIDGAAVQQAVALYYGDQLAADRTTQPTLNRCQQAIGRETQRFLAATSKAVALCWDSRNRGQHHDDCPDPAAAAGTPGRRAADSITRAATRRDDWICRSCGGDDGLCDGLGDFSPSVIGSAATCPSVTIPGGANCAGPIATLHDLVDCAECVTRFQASCMDRAASPAFAPYPASCN